MPIKENELIRYNPFDDEIELVYFDNDELRETLPTIGYYAMFEYHNGFKKVMYWSKNKMLAHADKYSAAFSALAYRDIQDGKISQRDMWKYSSYWYTDFDGMACKTMLRQLISKWGIMSIEMQRAYEADGGVIGENGEVSFSDAEREDTTPAQQEIIETVPAEPESNSQAEESNDFSELLGG